MPNQPASPISPADMDPSAELPMPGQPPAQHDGREQEDSELEPDQQP